MNTENKALLIRHVQTSDFPFLSAHDPHIDSAMMQQKIAAREMLIAEMGIEPVGLLRWGWFWDNTPFMNLLFVVESWRGKGIGSRLTAHWESLMRVANAEFVLTSTYSHESGQHFYRKRGYQDIGGFALPGEPLEIILYKRLRM